jgi:O-antigen/teichoic acid export membrane protein
MGLPVAVARYARDDGEEARALFGWAVAYTSVTSAVGTAGYFVLFRGDIAGRFFTWGPVVGVLLFFLLVTGMSLAFLVEIRLMALRKWGWVLWRVLVLGVARFPLLWLPLVGDDVIWLLLLVAGAPAVTGFIGVVLLQGGRGWNLWPPSPRAVQAFRYASVNWVGLLTEKAPAFVLPMIVAVRVDEVTFATFYYVWMVTLIVFLVPETVGRVLLAEGGRDGVHASQQIRLGLLLQLPTMAAIALGARMVPDLIGRIFGAEYAAAEEVFPAFMLAGIPWAITTTAVARARISEHSAHTVAITVAYAAATLGPALLLTDQEGLGGAADAWLLGHAVAAVVGAATLWRDVHSRRGDPTPARQ